MHGINTKRLEFTNLKKFIKEENHNCHKLWKKLWAGSSEEERFLGMEKAGGSIDVLGAVGT